jgi:hypothetical protein
MSAYIKLSTGEYPRYIGDIEIDDAGMGDYAPVEWIDPPEAYNINRVIVTEPPVQVDGKWYMVWSVRDATPEEIEDRKKPPVELDALLKRAQQSAPAP